MRVYCPIHRRGFLAPRKNPVRCENKSHVLGELDFEGRAREPVELRWEYCCNCEHFWTSEFAHSQCPVCDRQVSARYLCDRCYTFSLESNAPAAVKNFTLTPEGAPHPACPGCLREAPPHAALRQHQCDDLGVSFTTAFRSCPVCGSLIGEAPPFPAANAEYLRAVKAGIKVRLDYERDMLVESGEGEFVLIPRGTAAGEPIALPALTSFTSRQDFYQNYQDCYHCENPAAGDVIIMEPAVVAKVEGGWRLREAGRLEVRAGAAREHKADTPAAGSALTNGSPAATGVRSGREKPPVVCRNCGVAVEPENLAWGFCWNCGKPLGAAEPDATRESQSAPPPPAARREERALAPRPSSSSPFLSILEPSVSERAVPERVVATTPLARAGGGGARRALPLALAALALLVAVGSVAWLMLRSPAPPSAPAGVGGRREPAQAVGGATAAQTPAPAPTISPEDEEIAAIRRRMESASPSERPQIVKDLQADEQKYSADYRFPYERAKLSIKGFVAHDEAFAALVAAAGRAMATGKARQMFEELTVDEQIYFRKTATGHEEWKQLLEALRNEDRNKLGGLVTRMEKKPQH